METITTTKFKIALVSLTDTNDVEQFILDSNAEVLNVKTLFTDVTSWEQIPAVIIVDDVVSKNWQEDFKKLKKNGAFMHIPLIVITDKKIDVTEHINYLEQGVFAVVNKNELAQLQFLSISAAVYGEKIKQEYLKTKKLNKELCTNYLLIDAKTTKLKTTGKKIDKLVTEQSNTDLAVVKNLILDLNEKQKEENYYELFQKHFKQLYPFFYQNILAVNSSLTDHNIKLLSFIKMGFSNNEISLLLNVSLAAVKKSIQRLKPKLGIDKEDSIREFLN